jgi:hypothetical protein
MAMAESTSQVGNFATSPEIDVDVKASMGVPQIMCSRDLDSRSQKPILSH